MKKTILFAACLMVLNLSAGGDHPNKYCAKMKDGKLVVMHEGAAITADVTLANGTIIHPDGSVMKKDGSKMMLKEGECLDKGGIVHEEKHEEKGAKTKGQKS